MSKLIFEEETYKIIGLCMKVHRKLGSGFLESVYQEVLAKEFTKASVPFKEQIKLNIYYEEEKMDKYFKDDFLCYEEIILEIKATSFINIGFEKQLINYLNATHKQLGLLVNFGEKSLKWKRFINT